MKKVFVFTLICLALLLLVPGVVSASNQNIDWNSNQASATGTTEVTYGVTSMFTLNIPDTIHISSNYDEGIGIVSISGARIPANTFVNVSVTSPNYDNGAQSNQPAWRMKLDSNSVTDYVYYHLHKTDNINQADLTHDTTVKVARGEVFLSLQSGTRYKETHLVLFIDDSNTHHSGIYKDQLEFTAMVTDSSGLPYSPQGSP